jgi:hypothetical protein
MINIQHFTTTLANDGQWKGYYLVELGGSYLGLSLYMFDDKLHAIAGGTTDRTFLETSIPVFTGSRNNWSAIYSGSATIKMTLYQDSSDFACMFLSIDDGTTSNVSYVSINPTSDNLQIIGGDTGGIGGHGGQAGRVYINYKYAIFPPRNFTVDISRYYGTFTAPEPEPEAEPEPEPEPQEPQSITYYVEYQNTNSPYYHFKETENGGNLTHPITLNKGIEYTFTSIDVPSSHPFSIGESWGNNYDSIGSIQGSGTSITFTVPESTSTSTLKYYCIVHDYMVGNINIS